MGIFSGGGACAANNSDYALQLHKGKNETDHINN